MQFKAFVFQVFTTSAYCKSAADLVMTEPAGLLGQVESVALVFSPAQKPAGPDRHRADEQARRVTAQLFGGF